ncbi:hypothetical protein HDV62DRAFT_270217 [Trichoderma sp. SZMC 28011]
MGRRVPDRKLQEKHEHAPPSSKSSIPPLTRKKKQLQYSFRDGTELLFRQVFRLTKARKAASKVIPGTDQPATSTCARASSRARVTSKMSSSRVRVYCTTKAAAPMATKGSRDSRKWMCQFTPRGRKEGEGHGSPSEQAQVPLPSEIQRGAGARSGQRLRSRKLAPDPPKNQVLHLYSVASNQLQLQYFGVWYSMRRI